MRQYSQTAIRAIVAEFELDQIFQSQQQLSIQVKDALQESASHWGFNVNKCEISDIVPNKELSEELVKYAREERERKHQRLEAENRKTIVDIDAEAEKIRTENERFGPAHSNTFNA